MSPSSPRKKSNNVASGGCLAVFGLPFLAGGLITSWLYFAPYLHYLEARSWVKVPCRIESAKLEEHRDSDGDTLKCLVTYHYRYGGRDWKSDRVSLYKGADNISDFQQRTYQELSSYVSPTVAEAPDSNVNDSPPMFRCYVNPHDPSEAVLFRRIRWQMQAFMAIFALTFPAVGAGLFLGGLSSAWKYFRSQRLASTFLEGRPELGPMQAIPETSSPLKTGLALYTAWSGMVIAPLIASALASGALEESPSAAFLVIYPLLWCVPAWFTLRHLRQHLLIGRARFQPAGAPATTGARLEGHILLDRPPPSRSTVELILECTRVITRKSSDGDTTSSETVWKQAANITGEAFSRDAAFTRIPVNFALPADVPPSGPSAAPNTAHVWTLRLRVPGTPIQSNFEVPVTEEPDSPARDQSPTPPPSERTFAMLPDLLAARRIHAKFSTDGTPASIVCPPARNRSTPVSLTLFNLVWTGAAVWLVTSEAPMIFVIFWPGSALIVWCVILWMLIHKRTVTLDGNGLKVTNQLGPFMHTRVLEKCQIRRFSHDTNMTSGNTNFYRVRLEDTAGKWATVADNITDSATAEALAIRLNEWREYPITESPHD